MYTGVYILPVTFQSNKDNLKFGPKLTEFDVITGKMSGGSFLSDPYQVAPSSGAKEGLIDLLGMHHKVPTTVYTTLYLDRTC